MPAVAAAEPQLAELARALNEAGEKELRRMARAARMARDRFHLFPIESDFTPALRAALLNRLQDDLAINGLRLRVVTLTPACWNVLAALEQEPPILAGDVMLLIGLESTPGIVREVGAKPQRPPALSALNQWREVLRQQIAVPLFVWCPTYVYTALLEHAPDFFDQYTAKFHFTNAAPSVFTETLAIGSGAVISSIDTFTNKPSFGSLAAVGFYRKQVAANPNATYERALELLNLAHALIQLIEPDKIDAISEAKACVEEAVHTLARRRSKDARYLWAVAQMTLGLLNADLISGDHNANLRRALTCYKATMRFFTEADYSIQWAMTQLLCGEVYAKLTSDKRDTNLRRSITCYQAAQHFYTEVDFPTEWARTQLGIGFVYITLSAGDKLVNFQRAIACYEAALRVYTEAAHPSEWAKVQLLLGIALSYLFLHHNTPYLHQALVSIKAALRIYTEANQPDLWAVTNQCLATLLILDNDIDNAEKAYQKARRGFTAVGDIKMVQEVEAALQSLALRTTSA